jgi:hypothetical protein
VVVLRNDVTKREFWEQRIRAMQEEIKKRMPPPPPPPDDARRVRPPPPPPPPAILTLMAERIVHSFNFLSQSDYRHFLRVLGKRL